MQNDLLKKRYGKVTNVLYENGYTNGMQKLLDKHRNDVVQKIYKIIDELISFDVDKQYKNHVLNDGKTYELHVAGDVLLTYRYDTNKLYVNLKLINITNHKKLNSSIEKRETVDKILLDYIKQFEEKGVIKTIYAKPSDIIDENHPMFITTDGKFIDVAKTLDANSYDSSDCTHADFADLVLSSVYYDINKEEDSYYIDFLEQNGVYESMNFANDMLDEICLTLNWCRCNPGNT